jgi:hypothetical protein
MGRDFGFYEYPEADLHEPARTERLLSQPLFTLHRGNASDTMDALKLFWLRKAGDGTAGISVNATLLGGQLIVVAIVGLVPTTNTGRYAQLIALMCIQAILIMYLLVRKPMCDHLECAAADS